ncbi:Mitochondrial import receptor subunit TOM70 [Madurella mycetomatis]|uniref:Mitochondrial import receptor subunit TOM70 n=1 Tax=Madurella mycetomatis TaxID=100816 RepID=A0A175W4G5_9PEZI|nr:Mitochondrial import receptor subunit TOM70 [Madurella mycetomatis]
MSIVEDENGNHLLLQLYHQEEGTDGAAEDILVEGIAMIVEESYLKLTSDNGYGLRVDHLSDIIFLSADDERIPSRWQRRSAQRNHTAMAWKTRGNDYFGKPRYRTAIECYTQALGGSPTAEETHTIKLHRSLAFLKTKQFDAALSDLESATTAPKPAEKALFRNAQALYGLRRYRECCGVLKALRMEYPKNSVGKVQLDRAVKRLAEQTTGKYQLEQLHAEAAKPRPPHIDHAAYIGPVHVKASGSRGRELFISSTVKAGDLLFCEKAFATHSSAREDVVPMVLPSWFLVRRIIALNAFGSLLSTRQSCLRALSQDCPAQGMVKGPFHSYGIWPMASYINHYCYSNAWTSFTGT